MRGMSKRLPHGNHYVCIVSIETKGNAKGDGKNKVVTLDCISGEHEGKRHPLFWPMVSDNPHALGEAKRREAAYISAACGDDFSQHNVRDIEGAMFRPFMLALEPSKAEWLSAKPTPCPAEHLSKSEEACEALRKRLVPTAPGQRAGLVLRRGSNVKMKPIRWLWRNRFAIGKVSMMTGDPGLGKSQVSLMMAAKVSIGGAWPNDEGSAPVGNALILCCEDDVSDTVGPRLVAAGANMDRIYIAEAVREGEGTERMFNMSADIQQIDKLLTNAAAESDPIKLIIIDPISAYMGDVNTDKQSEVRAVLGPYKALAEKHGVAIVAVAHPPKNVPSGKAVNAVGGSGAYVGAARAVWMFAKEFETDPETRERSETGRVLMLEAKQNAGKAKGLAYRIEQATVPTEEGDAETSYVIFDDGDVETTADDVLKPNTGSFGRAPLNKTEAAKWLLNMELKAGPQEQNQLVAKAKAQGISYDTLNNARKELGIESVGQGSQGLVMWTYPGWSPEPVPASLFS